MDVVQQVGFCSMVAQNILNSSFFSSYASWMVCSGLSVWSQSWKRMGGLIDPKGSLEILSMGEGKTQNVENKKTLRKD